MEAFANGQLEEFDALVGDTACQIRAAKVCDLAQNLRKLSEEDKAFLVNCYFLKHTKCIIQNERSYQEITNDALAVEKFKISKSQALTVRKHAQRSLAQASVAYVQSLTKPTQLPHLIERIDSYGRSLIPCYFSMKALLRTPRYILLQCIQFPGKRSGQMLYAPPKQKKMSYSPVPMAMGKPVMVIEGYCEGEDPAFMETIQKISLKTILLANAAQHAQYPGGMEMPPISDGKQKKKFEGLKRFADEMGCSLKNPSLFCIDHIYCKVIPPSGEK